MRIRVQKGGIGVPPQETDDADSVVIYTDDGKPICVAIGLEGNVWVKTVADPQFAAILEDLGFSKRQIPQNVDTINMG